MIEEIKKLYSLTVSDELLIKIAGSIYRFIEASNILELDSEINEEIEE